MKSQIAIIGGGAAGFFCAAILAEKLPAEQITIYERAEHVLQKVKISGGGRCNVTHAGNEPAELVKNYPRGTKELLGPFHNFDNGDTMNWFENHGVKLKTENDGRIFPVTDSSQTIIDCLWEATIMKGVNLKTRCAVKHFCKENEQWKISSEKGEFIADELVIATGGSQQFWNLITVVTGHKLVAPVPSLFTFNCSSPLIKDLPGVVIPMAEVSLSGSSFSAKGPVLITHWGLSGPAILRLSAWGARWLHEKEYHFAVDVNWKPGWQREKALEWLLLQKKQFPKKKLQNLTDVQLPARFWQSLVLFSLGNEERVLGDLPNRVLEKIALDMTSTKLDIKGKSTYKDEFVTAGGIALNEVDFKTFQSKLHKGLFFAGEVLDIDAITGGFNFQSAWTGAHIAAGAILKKINP